MLHSLASTGKQPIIVPDKVEVGKQFAVYCDGSRVAGIDDACYDAVSRLEIARQLEKETSFTTMATYDGLNKDKYQVRFLNRFLTFSYQCSCIQTCED
jgi:hypothetical protein